MPLDTILAALQFPLNMQNMTSLATVCSVTQQNRQLSPETITHIVFGLIATLLNIIMVFQAGFVVRARRKWHFLAFPVSFHKVLI